MPAEHAIEALLLLVGGLVTGALSVVSILSSLVSFGRARRASRASVVLLVLGTALFGGTRWMWHRAMDLDHEDTVEDGLFPRSTRLLVMDRSLGTRLQGLATGVPEAEADLERFRAAQSTYSAAVAELGERVWRCLRSTHLPDATLRERLRYEVGVLQGRLAEVRLGLGVRRVARAPDAADALFHELRESLHQQWLAVGALGEQFDGEFPLGAPATGDQDHLRRAGWTGLGLAGLVLVVLAATFRRLKRFGAAELALPAAAVALAACGLVLRADAGEPTVRLLGEIHARLVELDGRARALREALDELGAGAFVRRAEQGPTPMELRARLDEHGTRLAELAGRLDPWTAAEAAGDSARDALDESYARLVALSGESWTLKRQASAVASDGH